MKTFVLTMSDYDVLDTLTIARDYVAETPDVIAAMEVDDVLNIESSGGVVVSQLQRIE